MSQSWITRPFGPQGVDRWTALAAGLVACALATVVLTLRDYGVTYDEFWHATYGDYIIDWYSTFFHDDGALSYWNLFNYGGAFDLPAQLVVRLSPMGLFETRHALVALIGLAGIVGAYKAGAWVGGSQAGFCSALFLLLTPRYYGDMFQNHKDIPFAVAFLYTLYLIMRSIPSLPTISWRLRVQLGVVIGLLLGIRVGGVLVFGPWAAVLCLWWALRATAPGAGPRPAVIRPLLAGGLCVCGIAYAVMLVGWPMAQAHPVQGPVRAFAFATNFRYVFDVFFDGGWIKNTDLPAHYLIRWFAVTLPEFYFVAMACGLVTLVRAAPASWRAWIARDQSRFLSVVLLATAIAFPFAFYAVKTPVTYDGVRHFLFTIPPLAVLSGASVAAFLARIQRPAIRTVCVAALGGLLALTSWDMWQLHPYQYVYFNRVVIGGLPGAATRFDTDYWGASYKEGVRWLIDHAPEPPSGRKLKVASCSHSASTTYFLPTDRFDYVGSYHDGQLIFDEPDVLLATTRWECDKTRKGQTLHVVERMGVPLLYVIEVDHDDGSAVAPPSWRRFGNQR